MSGESEGKSFWDRLLGDFESPREERVIEYVNHRIGEGAGLREVLGEEYVRRNASPTEIEDILQNPRLIESAHEHLRRDFASGDLDPTRRPG